MEKKIRKQGKKVNLIQKKEMPKLVNIVILGKFEDGKVRQIFADKQTQIHVLATIQVLNKDGIRAIEKPIENVDFKSDIDLRVRDLELFNL